MACPACISCPASRQVADAHDTRMMIIKADPIWSVGTHCWQPVSILGNVGSDLFISPTRPDKPLCQQHSAIRQQLSCQPGAGSSSNLDECGNFPVNNSDISPGFRSTSTICRGPSGTVGLISMDESLDDPVDDSLAGRPHTSLIEEVGDYGQI